MTRAWTLLLAMACSGPQGDWVAVDAQQGDRISVARGLLEIDRRGDTRLQLTLDGSGPSGALEATGTSTPIDRTAELDLEGTWRLEGSELIVYVEGPCEGAVALTCELSVGGADWIVRFER